MTVSPVDGTNRIQPQQPLVNSSENRTWFRSALNGLYHFFIPREGGNDFYVVRFQQGSTNAELPSRSNILRNIFNIMITSGENALHADMRIQLNIEGRNREVIRIPVSNVEEQKAYLDAYCDMYNISGEQRARLFRHNGLSENGSLLPGRNFSGNADLVIPRPDERELTAGPQSLTSRPWFNQLNETDRSYVLRLDQESKAHLEHINEYGDDISTVQSYYSEGDSRIISTAFGPELNFTESDVSSSITFGAMHGAEQQNRWYHLPALILGIASLAAVGVKGAAQGGYNLIRTAVTGYNSRLLARAGFGITEVLTWKNYVKLGISYGSTAASIYSLPTAVQDINRGINSRSFWGGIGYIAAGTAGLFGPKFVPTMGVKMNLLGIFLAATHTPEDERNF